MQKHESRFCWGHKLGANMGNVKRKPRYYWKLTHVLFCPFLIFSLARISEYGGPGAHDW